MAGPEFVHLHVHSQYSMLDGAVKVKDLVKRVAKEGMKAVAVTDHGNMFGAISFYKAAKEAGVQAILGCEVEIADRGRARHLPLIASTLEGYKNLVTLVSMGHVRPEADGPAGLPTVSLETVAKHAKGLIAMTGCMGGVTPQAILEEGEEAGKKSLERLKEIFEPGALYVELQDHGLPEQPIVNDILLQHARFFGLPVVATNDVHFPERDDAQAHLYLSCIKTGRTYAEALERHHGSGEMYLKSPIEMAELFSSHPNALKATLEIAERCKSLKLKLGEPMLPSFVVPEGYDTESYFREVARKGLERRFEELGNVDKDKYRARLEMELDVIAKMKFPGYFLIVWDFIRYAKENGVPVGPGRGSGAGSIVAYAMRITDLDPIPYALLFERFLNPERVSMPDFDVDFCMDKRDRVIAYVQKKYGEESVGQIATFAELKAKSVIKDVARGIGILPVEAQAIANLIPRKSPAETYTIQESLTIEPKLKARFETEPQVRELLTQASKLEGLTRHAGKHAAGIVISEGPLWDHVPVFKDPQSNSYVTQYYKDDVEAAGLVKFDFLGLKTLTVLDIATQLIKARAPDFDLSKIPMDDKPTFALLASGETKGVFQLESSGMQQLFKDLKADNFEDIVAAVALYRPGPLGSGMVTDFVNRKHGKAKVESLHPMVDSILVPTYGVIVYQEQVMQVAQALAGYTLGGADILRRAMGKKKPEEMAKQKGIFIEGATKKGVTQEDAERIFGLLEFFAGYGFNKCVIGATEIMDARTGERTTVGDLFRERRPFSIHALGEDGKLRARRVTDVMWNGRKRVYRLTTAQGKRITATANHPFKTLEGWKNLGDLRVGDRVAAPRRLGVATSARWPAHELIALAGLLSEGNTCHPTCLYFFGNERKLVDDFAEAASKFPSSVARVYQRPNEARYEVCVSTGRDTRFKPGQRPWNARGGAAVAIAPVRSGMFAWAHELGILGKKATEKDVPEPVFALADEDIELFLGRLWAGDGFIANATQFVPFYATSSRALAKSVQTLLLRLGITSGVHEKTFRYRGGERTGFTVHVVGDGAVERFVERLAPHCLGRDSAVASLRKYVASTKRGQTSKDTIPRAIADWVDEDRRSIGLTWRELEQRSGVCVKELCGPSKNKKAFRRATIAAVGRALASERLNAAAASDVFWDEVVSIEDAGVEDTYDLTVDVDHNFVADGLCVHNSHSAAYALITYQTAWLKAHYPTELLCAILTSDKDRIEKVVRTIADARAMGITVLPPDINESDTDFKVVYTDDGAAQQSGKKRKRSLPQIRFGLGAVRGVGGAALESIYEARQNGKFIDLFDFASRVDAAKINKAVLQALVQCGAFDSTFGALGTSRAQAYASIDVALERLRAATRDRERGQTSLFGLFDAAPAASSSPSKWNAPSAGDYVEAAPWDRKEMLTRERQSLGFYVSGHPLERYLRGPAALQRLEALPASTCNDQQDWAVVKLAGMVEGYRERIFRDGASSNKLAFFELEDLSGRVNVKVRGNQIDTYAHVLTSGEPVLVTGKVSFPRRDEDEPEPDADVPREATILLNDAVLLSDVVAAGARQVLLRLHADQIREGTLDKVQRVMRESPGNCGVSVHLTLGNGAEATLSLGPNHRVEIGDTLLAGLERIFGAQVAELR